MVEAKAGSSLQPQQTHLVKPKTRKGKRYLEKRGPKLVRPTLPAQLSTIQPRKICAEQPEQYA